VDVERVAELPLWEGDRHFLPMMFERTDRQFHGVMPYRDGRPVSWSYSLV
jgi:8-oxo-dGTP diphosphatase